MRQTYKLILLPVPRQSSLDFERLHVSKRCSILSLKSFNVKFVVFNSCLFVKSLNLTFLKSWNCFSYHIFNSTLKIVMTFNKICFHVACNRFFLRRVFFRVHLHVKMIFFLFMNFKSAQSQVQNFVSYASPKNALNLRKWFKFESI